MQFACGFLVCGCVAFLYVGSPENLTLHLLKTVAVASIGGALAGRFGDAAWAWIVALLSWS